MDENGKFVYHNGMSYFNVNNNIWFHSNSNQTIEGREGHSLFTYNDKIYLYGGWNWDTKIHFMDLLEFDPKYEVWTHIVVSGNNHPNVYEGACGMIGSRVFMFGGIKGKYYLNELYSFDLKMLSM